MENTRNSLSVSYTVDKTNQVGYFVLKLLRDNMPVKVEKGARIYATAKDSGNVFEWSNPIYNDGQIFLRAEDFQGINQKGTYFLRVILNSGEIYPSSGKCILKLKKDLTIGVGGIQIVQGINGKDGVSQSLDDIKILVKEAVKDIPTIAGKDGKDGQNGLSAYQIAVRDGFRGTETEWIQSLKGPKGDKGDSITGPKGDKGDSITGPAGQNGKDAPHVTRVTYDNNQLIFAFSDGSSLSTPFIMPVAENGTNGKDGKDGKNAPTIESVNYADNELIFSFSDGSKKSTPFVMPTPINGKDGKSAPIVTSVNYANDLLTFNFSDSTSKSTSFIMPTPKDGKDGKPGKDAPTITNVDLNDSQTQLIFTFSDGSKLQTEFKAPEAIAGPKGQDGTPGKDAPKITSVRLNGDQTKLIFTLSDNSELEAEITIPKPKDGKDGLSAYELAKQSGFKGTEQEWLQSLKGDSNIKDTLDASKVLRPLYLQFGSSSYGTGNLSQLTRKKPWLKIERVINNNSINLQKGTPDIGSDHTDMFFNREGNVSLKPIFDELDTKANKSDVPTSESIVSQIDQNLKEKLKKDIVTKITPPAYLDETGKIVKSGLAIDTYNANGDSENSYLYPKELVALNNSNKGYSFDIPIIKLSVSDNGVVSMWLQATLTDQVRPKLFSIGKTDIMYPDPSEAKNILSTDNEQGTSYTYNDIQISNVSDYFSGLPVTVVNANIKESTPEARESFKQAFSDFSSKFYFLHIEG